MAGRRIIRLGDPTTTGGRVITACSDATDQGKPIARLGDIATCPACRRGKGPIVECEPKWNVFGIPIALEGHRVACGCSGNYLVGVGGASTVDHSGAAETVTDTPVSGKGSSDKFDLGVAGFAAVQTITDQISNSGGNLREIRRTAEPTDEMPENTKEYGAAGSSSDDYSECFQILHEETKEPLDKVFYCIETQDGKTYTGTTDSKGYTTRVFTKDQNIVKLRTGRDAKLYLKEKGQG